MSLLVLQAKSMMPEYSKYQMSVQSYQIFVMIDFTFWVTMHIQLEHIF
nr:unnamed protein product [Callosobruchus analis]